MKKRYLFIITIIVLAHIAFVWLFVLPKKSVENRKPTNTQITQKNKQKASSLLQEPNKSKKIKNENKQKPLLKPKQRDKNFHEFEKKEKKYPSVFNYKHAIWGNIKSIPDTRYAKTGILVYADTGMVLWAKNPNKPVPIASMTKMMTILLAMKKIESDPNITLKTMVKVTPSAARIGGSQVWLDPRESFSLEDLLKTLAIKSANDSAELIAEFFGEGDRNVFVDEMNKLAKRLKLYKTHFSNPHGLPERQLINENKSSAHDLAVLAEQLLSYPQIIKWSSTWTDYIRKNTKKPTLLRNHNHLIRDCPGVDGMKTGYTKRAKFCITVTCQRNEKRLIAVVTGVPKRKQRDSLVRNLLDWGYKRIALFATEKSK